MRDRAAQEGDILHAGDADIPDELAMPGQVPRILLAMDPGADAGTGRHCSVHGDAPGE